MAAQNPDAPPPVEPPEIPDTREQARIERLARRRELRAFMQVAAVMETLPRDKRRAWVNWLHAKFVQEGDYR